MRTREGWREKGLRHPTTIAPGPFWPCTGCKENWTTLQSAIGVEPYVTEGASWVIVGRSGRRFTAALYRVYCSDCSPEAWVTAILASRHARSCEAEQVRRQNELPLIGRSGDSKHSIGLLAARQRRSERLRLPRRRKPRSALSSPEAFPEEVRFQCTAVARRNEGEVRWADVH